MDAKEGFRERLAALIKESGKTATDISKESRVPRSSLTSYAYAVDGVDYICVKNACALADYFGVSLDYLFGRSELKSPVNGVPADWITTDLEGGGKLPPIGKEVAVIADNNHLKGTVLLSLREDGTSKAWFAGAGRVADLDDGLYWLPMPKEPDGWRQEKAKRADRYHWGDDICKCRKIKATLSEKMKGTRNEASVANGVDDEALRYAWAKIPEAEQKLVLELLLSGKSYNEIGDLYGIAKGTVGSKTHNAWEALKQYYSQKCLKERYVVRGFESNIASANLVYGYTLGTLQGLSEKEFAKLKGVDTRMVQRIKKSVEAVLVDVGAIAAPKPEAVNEGEPKPEKKQGRSAKGAQAKPDTKPYLSINETAYALGLSVSFVRQRCRDGAAPVLMMGSRPVINVKMFEKQLADEAKQMMGGKKANV